MAITIERLIGRIMGWVAMFAGALLFLMALTVSTDVVKRAITGKPILGVFEGVEMLLVAVTMGVLGLVEWQHRQLNVDVFTHRARGRFAVLLVVLDKALALLLIGILVKMAADEWLKAWNGWYLRRGMVEIPIVVPLGLILIGAVLCWLAAAWGCVKAVICFFTGGIYRVVDTGVEIGGAASGPAIGSH